MSASDQAIAWFGKGRIALAVSTAIAVLAGQEQWSLEDVTTVMSGPILMGTGKIFQRIAAIAIILLDKYTAVLVIVENTKKELKRDALNLSQDKLNANQSLTGC